jgi:hypothetical protein
MSFSESSEGLFSLPCTTNQPRAHQQAWPLQGRGLRLASDHQQRADSTHIKACGLRESLVSIVGPVMQGMQPSLRMHGRVQACLPSGAAGAARGGLRLLTVLYILGLARAVRLPVALALSDSRGCSLLWLPLVVVGPQGGATSRLQAMSWAVS